MTGDRGLVSSQRGVTLIELMMTLVILAILVTLAAPSFADIIRTSRVRSAAMDLAAALNMARSEAVKRGLDVTVCKSANTDADPNDPNPALRPACTTAGAWTSGWLMFVDTGTRGTVDAADVRLKVGKPSGSGITISGGANFSNYVSYLSAGSSLGNGNLANGAIDICLSGVQRRLVINTTGRLRIDKGTC